MEVLGRRVHDLARLKDGDGLAELLAQRPHPPLDFRDGPGDTRNPLEPSGALPTEACGEDRRCLLLLLRAGAPVDLRRWRIGREAPILITVDLLVGATNATDAAGTLLLLVSRNVGGAESASCLLKIAIVAECSPAQGWRSRRGFADELMECGKAHQLLGDGRVPSCAAGLLPLARMSSVMAGGGLPAPFVCGIRGRLIAFEEEQEEGSSGAFPKNSSGQGSESQQQLSAASLEAAAEHAALSLQKLPGGKVAKERVAAIRANLLAMGASESPHTQLRALRHAAEEASFAICGAENGGELASLRADWAARAELLAESASAAERDAASHTIAALEALCFGGGGCDGRSAAELRRVFVRRYAAAVCIARWVELAEKAREHTQAYDTLIARVERVRLLRQRLLAAAEVARAREAFEQAEQ